MSVSRQIAIVAAFALTALAFAWYGSGDFTALWLTADQRGRLAYERKDFPGAAELFEDPMWAGVAGYDAGTYLEAAAAFGRVPTAIGLFNRGNALLKGREYHQAVSAYEQAVKLDPVYAPAARNLELARYVIDYLEQLRAASDTGDESELSADGFKFDKKSKDGTEMVINDVSRLEAKSADKWMRSVDTRMRDYLQIRFAVEASRGETP